MIQIPLRRIGTILLSPSTNLTTNLTAPTEVLELPYDIPHTDISLIILLFINEPVERQALGAAIYSGRRWIARQIKEQGGGWLDDSDNPYVSTVPERCFIRIDSKKTEAGRAKMTYWTLLKVLEAMWTVLYLERRERELSMRIDVAGIVAGYGRVSVRGFEGAVSAV
ncbi:MAG: hypothetical protein Q9219_006821 [cf. Caloplaca sp. 3 TL-2023]